MKPETETQGSPKSEIEKVLANHYRYLVVDPYAVNLIDQGPRKGQARFSFYSALLFIQPASFTIQA